MKTRSQLREKGILLEGMVIPQWFKEHCDGCSVPRPFRRIAYSGMMEAACNIHDGDYTVIPILHPKGSRECRRLRREADKRLYRNCKMVASSFNRFRVRGWILSPAYYVGVRFGGGVAMTHPREKTHRLPKTMTQRAEFLAMINERYRMTRYGEDMLKELFNP